MDFFGEIRVAVLAYGDMVDIGNLRAHCVKTGFDCESGKTGKMFMAVEPFFGDGEGEVSIDNDGRRGVGMKHVESKNEHVEVGVELAIFSGTRFAIMRSDGDAAEPTR